MNLPKYFYFKINANEKENEITIEDASDLDVAEVIRCKNCKYRDTMPEYEYDDDHMHRMLMGTEFCRWWHDECPNDDDYCSYGERAEG